MLKKRSARYKPHQSRNIYITKNRHKAEGLLKDIREGIRKTNHTLDEMLKEIKAYVAFRKGQKK